MVRERVAGMGRGSMFMVHFAAALLAVVDFILFHVAAVALTLAIYFTIPILDDAISRGSPDWRWLGIFQIVSPTVTISGGAVTVLSTYFYARRIQEMEKKNQEAELRAATAEAQLEAIKSQGQGATRRRRNRRRLRNSPSWRER